MPSTPSLRPSTSYFCSQPAPVSLRRWAPAFASPTSRRRLVFQLAEVLVTREMLTGILERISRLRLAPG